MFMEFVTLKCAEQKWLFSLICGALKAESDTAVGVRYLLDTASLAHLVPD